LNTNAHWIAKQVTDAGGIVKRVTIVRDEVNAIASAIRESLRRQVYWIIVSGGLGPTYDDKTLQGLARALGKKLVINKKAVRMLRRKYQRTSNPTLTPSRIKMATLPAKAEPLENPIGHAPAVLVKHASCLIFSLPGVPTEMMAIFTKHMTPVLKRKIGGIFRIETNLETTSVMESVIAPYLHKVVASNPKVYIKSHPRGYKKGISKLHISLVCESKSLGIAEKSLRRAVREMKQSVIDAGGKTREI
jgi:molybdenum cofactor synthesis domain-containing protein